MNSQSKHLTNNYYIKTGHCCLPDFLNWKSVIIEFGLFRVDKEKKGG